MTRNRILFQGSHSSRARVDSRGRKDRSEDLLLAELANIGFAFALLTPDDVASAAAVPRTKRNRARQNVVFEHGMLVGMLGPERECLVSQPKASCRLWRRTR